VVDKLLMTKNLEKENASMDDLKMIPNANTTIGNNEAENDLVSNNSVNSDRMESRSKKDMSLLKAAKRKWE